MACSCSLCSPRSNLPGQAVGLVGAEALARDARSTIDGYKAAEQAIASGWSPKDCTAAAVGKAKRVAALVRGSQVVNRP